MNLFPKNVKFLSNERTLEGGNSLGSFNNLENIWTLMSIITLFDTQELTLIEINAKIELKAIIAKSEIEYKKAESLERISPNKLSTIWPVISGIAVSKAVAKTIIIEMKINLPKWFLR